MEEMDGAADSDYTEAQRHVVNYERSILANPNIVAGIGFIVADAPSYKVRNGKLAAIFNILNTNDVLNDFVEIADGNPTLIHFGIDKLIEESMLIRGESDVDYKQIDPESFSYRAWQDAFRYLYEKVYPTNSSEAHTELAKIFTDKKAIKNLKRGFASYFYDLAMDMVSDRENDGSRLFLNAVEPVISNGLLPGLQKQREFADPHRKKVIRGNILEGVNKRLEDIAKKRLPSDLVACFDGMSEDIDPYHVTYVGLLNAAHDRLKHIVDENNRVVGQYQKHHAASRKEKKGLEVDERTTYEQESNDQTGSDFKFMKAVLSSKTDNMLLHHCATLLNGHRPPKSL